MSPDHPLLRPLLHTAAGLSAALLIATSCTGAVGDPARAGRADSVEATAGSEAAELVEVTEQRLEALDAARRDGSLGLIEPIRREAAPGWVGERLINPTGDDWEPAVAADPNAPYVYVLHNRFGGRRACREDCPKTPMILHVSKDGGRTFGAERFICECRGVKWQFDPLIEVVPDTGDVYAAWMNGWHVVFSRSSDHGRTWSIPVPVHPDVKWGDKPILATSADGADVYVAFNGPGGGDPYVSASHDGGTTWSAVKAGSSERYTFAYGGHVAADGAVVFTEISFSYTGPRDAAEGPILIHVLVSTDAGATWSDTVVETLELGVPCTSKGCYADFYDSGPALAADADDDLVMIYDGASKPEGPRTVYARSSTDDGATWSDPVRLSRSGVNSAFPAAAGFGDGEIRLWFMDQRTGRWNVWYRSSSDLGATWTKPVRISDATSGTAYKSRAGFAEAYGDYGEIAITSEGKTVAVWAEGISYAGPGGVWFNRQR